MSRVYVRRSGEDPQDAHLCELLEWEDKYCGKSEEETAYELIRQEVRKNAVKRAEQEAQCNLDEFVEREVENAKAAYAASVPEMTKTERLKDMKAKREKAKQELREQEAFTGPAHAPLSDDNKAEDGTVPESSSAESMSPILKKLRAHVDARKKAPGADAGKGADG